MKKTLLTISAIVASTLIASSQPKLTNFGVYDDFSTTKDYSVSNSTRGINWWTTTGVNSVTRDTVKKELIVHATQATYQYVPFGVTFGGTSPNANSIDLSANGKWSFDITNYGTEDLFLRVACVDDQQRMVDCTPIPNPSNLPFDALNAWAYQVQILVPAGKTVTFKAGSPNDAGKGYLNNCDFANGSWANWGTWDSKSQTHIGASILYTCDIKKIAGISITPMNAAKNATDGHALALTNGYFGISHFIVGDSTSSATALPYPIINLSDTTVTLDDTLKSSGTIAINSFTDKWTATSSALWLGSKLDTALGSGTLTITALANNTKFTRTAFITLNSKYGYKKNIIVNQRWAGDTTSITEINLFEKKQFHIIGNTVVFDSNDVSVYGIWGNRLSTIGNTSISLPNGIYIIKSLKRIDKIVISNQ